MAAAHMGLRGCISVRRPQQQQQEMRQQPGRREWTGLNIRSHGSGESTGPATREWSERGTVTWGYWPGPAAGALPVPPLTLTLNQCAQHAAAVTATVATRGHTADPLSLQQQLLNLLPLMPRGRMAAPCWWSTRVRV